MNPEQLRLKDPAWRKWGPYISDRQWGTVREDYSESGNAWESTTHEMAKSKAYRWGEEGIAGISDKHQLLCFSLALWNTHDPMLKERFFGLTNQEGNHGEDVKELYYYLDNTPSHSYMKMLYKYPQKEFPYQQLREENRRRSKTEKEFELLDTGILSNNDYFDVFVEYAKHDSDDILIAITIHNRSSTAAAIHVLPTLWFRNTWAWGLGGPPVLRTTQNAVVAEHKKLGNYFLAFEGQPALYFCNNETNTEKLYQAHSGQEYFKDGINDYLIKGLPTINPAQTGTKAALDYNLLIASHASETIQLRLSTKENNGFNDFNQVFSARKQEADDFYTTVLKNETPDVYNIKRQAFAGLLWNKQFYYYNIHQWLNGDPGQPVPPPQRLTQRNSAWKHFNSHAILSMPDKWEYPWFAACDLAFHAYTFAMVDIEFAKGQLSLLTQEYFMHPNGQFPAYEWNFSDCNPPIHAMAAWEIYNHEKQCGNGAGDVLFLEKMFHKLMINFTWWINRKDQAGNNIFEGGFLGMDNIGVLDRNMPLPDGAYIEQADSTGWMAMYSLNLLRIAHELSLYNPAYENITSKFFEHFLYIAGAMNGMDTGSDLWDEDDHFYYDRVEPANQGPIPLKLRSLVGLIPMLAVEVISASEIKLNESFLKRMEWFKENRPDLFKLVSHWGIQNENGMHLLSLIRSVRLRASLKWMFDENEFLSEFGIRSVSKVYEKEPYHLNLNGSDFSVKYNPAESDNNMFGGNSNWRGPIWIPLNTLLIGALERFYDFYGDDFKVEFPTGSGNHINLKQAASELKDRVMNIFKQNQNGERPVFGNYSQMQQDEYFKDLILFHEYFHGENGSGLGASHQTGWTALIATYRSITG